MTDLLQTEFSALIFAGAALAAMTWMHLWLRRTRKTPGVPLPAWLLLLFFIAFGCILADKAAESERLSLKRMLEGFAPTYAHEFERLGHAKIALDTPPDDPLYLFLIQIEKEWLQVNPLVNDIYTFRMKEDGSVVLLVDSETDYDHNGKYEGEREVRTAIGEPYPEADENLKRAFTGALSFDGVPYTDRWGTWVSAYAPMFDSQGHVEAVLGVDYDAKSWMNAINKRRAGMLGYVGISIVAYLAGIIVFLLSRYEKAQTDRAQAMLLKSAKENLRLVQAVDAASDGIVMTDPNQPDNPLIYANEMFLKITGYQMNEVLGRNMRFLQGPETDLATVDEIRRAVRERRPVRATLLNYRKDGTKFWNGTRITPIFSEGKLQYFLGVLADVTQRKEAEIALIAERDYTAFIMESAPVVICSVGADGRTNSLNATGEKVTGYPVKELAGKDWWETLYPGEDRGRVEKLLQELSKNNSVRDYEMTHTTKAGRRRTVLWNMIRCSDASGKLVEIVGFGNDITERKELESQLLQAQKMETVGTLAGGIAHDLNNQLTPLAGYIDLALKEAPPDDKNRPLLVEAEQAARRCAEVVQRLMGFSRTSTQKKHWFKTSVLLSELRELLTKFLPSTIEVRVESMGELWPALGNETELETVFMNLAANARDAMPEGGELKVKAENKTLDPAATPPGHAPGPHLVFTVSDTGAGIPRESLHKIFEPFFTTKPKGQGTGLGLAMVFRIVKDHGGWIDVASEPGKGTMFRIYLPTDPRQTGGGSAPASGGETLPRGTETILFVDDEETLRNIGRVFLERLGYKVLLAKDGEEAVSVYTQRRREIDAVVMDMTMPKLTGRQAMKRMMQIDPKVRVLLASGYTSEGSARELIQDGAKEFLPKPYTILPLAQALRKVIGRS